MAVWLASDGYDYNDDASVISATELLKSPRQIILGRRASAGPGQSDISDGIASKLGTAIHDAIEDSWINNYKQAMKQLGYPQRVIDNVVVNPKTVDEDDIPIYLEQRAHRKVGKWTVSGKYDFIGDGRLEDFKSTGTYTYVKKTNDKKYSQQGSIYRWLNPDKITNDTMAIQFIFTDWNKLKSTIEKGYPATRLLEYLIPLMPLGETDAWIKQKLNTIDNLIDTENEDLPFCTDEDLWRGLPVWKYYKSGQVSARSTKNFDNHQDAMLKNATDGGRGLVLEVKPEPKACNYCSASSVCSQRAEYVQSGELK